MKKSMTLLLAGMMLLGMVTVANASTISSIGDGLISSFDFGASGTTTVGQTFRLSEEGVGDDNLLDSVTFWITGYVEFTFYLYEWDGAKITGAPLFESGELSSTQSDPELGLTVDVGGVELDVNQEYVFFVSASAGSGSIDAVSYISDQLWCTLFSSQLCDPTPDHTLVHQDNGADFSLLSSTAWSKEPSNDMAFTMELSASGFEPEPEPEHDATFELSRAKVDLKKGTIKVDGQVVLPEGDTYGDLELEPVGTVKLHLFELKQPVEAVDDSVVLVEAVNDSVALEVKGRKGEKWQYKKRHDKKRHAFGVTEYKVHWKDDQTGTVKIKADFDPTLVDLSRLTPTLVAEFTLGGLEFNLTINENGQYDCKLKKKKWDFRNKP